MEVIHDPPTHAAFTPLSEHQSQTPSSFYSSIPVLHHHSANATLIILASSLISSPALSKLADAAHTNGVATNGDAHTHSEDEETVIAGLDVWITSENLLLYRPSLSTGLSIPYPSIGFHAIQTLSSNPPTRGLIMQIDTSDGFDDHDPDGTLSLTLIPAAAAPPSLPASAPEPDVPQDAQPPPPIEALFAAITACQSLHPDPVSDEEDDEGESEGGGPQFDYYESAETMERGGLPPPMPGSGGWITAENVGEFFDGEGNWRGGGLGPGAGIVRSRDDEGDQAVVGGLDVAADEVGEEDETKWRRTE